MKKMRFSKDMYYNDLRTPLYRAGEVYEVEDNMVVRWVKRGGVIVTEEKAPDCSIPPRPPEDDDIPSTGAVTEVSVDLSEGEGEEQVEERGEKKEDKAKTPFKKKTKKKT